MEASVVLLMMLISVPTHFYDEHIKSGLKKTFVFNRLYIESCPIMNFACIIPCTLIRHVMR